MRSEFDDVEIKDPPLEEFTSRGSCAKKSCGTCSGLILTVLIGSFLILKFTAPPSSTEIQTIPEPYAKTVPLYDVDNLDSIMFTTGAERSRGIELIAYLPKIILSPLLLSLDKKQVFLTSFRPGLVDAINQKTTYLDKLKVMLKEPIGDHRDLIVLTWGRLHADVSFVEEYYTKALKKQNFTIENISNSPTVRQYTFTKDTIDGSLFIEGSTSTPHTERTIVTLSVPSTYRP